MRRQDYAPYGSYTVLQNFCGDRLAELHFAGQLGTANQKVHTGLLCTSAGMIFCVQSDTGAGGVPHLQGPSEARRPV